VEEPDATGVPVDGAAPLAADPGVLTVGVDPPTVGVAGPGFGTVGVGASFGTVVEGAGGGFGTVTVGAGGGFGRVTVGIGRGRVEVVTVTVVTPGIGTVTARACPDRRPIAANPTRTAAALMSGQLELAGTGYGQGQVGKIGRVNVLKRDYYEVLGLPRDADEDAIKRAFYALARQFHPDVAVDPSAEDRFRELSEAYSVLSRRDARLLYDRYGYRGRGNQGFDEAIWDGRSERAPRGNDVHVEIVLRSFEADQGVRRLVGYEAAARCNTCLGRGSLGLPDPECEYCGGTGRTQTVVHTAVAQLLQVETCPVCVGEECSQCEGAGMVFEQRQLRVRIPPLVEDGTLLRIGGEGSDGVTAGSIPGDLLVHAEVLSPPTDPRLVRYAALVLLIIALATLLLYVLR
jgi:molecular chaperone DnaJ